MSEVDIYKGMIKKMKDDEIKEILKFLKVGIDKLCISKPDFSISYNDVKILLDYITNLQQKYDKALEILEEYGMPCERDNFNLLDTDYCELNCSNDDEQYKKCWNEFIEWRLRDEQ